jgi:hypothetical protein
VDFNVWWKQFASDPCAVALSKVANNVVEFEGLRYTVADLVEAAAREAYKVGFSKGFSEGKVHKEEVDSSVYDFIDW